MRTTDDILRAKKENKTGIIFGFQNSYAFEDNLGYIEVFKELGVNVVQALLQHPEPGRHRLL